MIRNRISTIAGTLAFAAGLIAAGPASAAINLGPGGDTLQNGAFNQMTFGAGGTANVFPLLYVGDLGDTGSAKSFLLGTDLSFGYVSPLPGLGTSVVSVTYSVTHNGDEFTDPFTDLRLMVSTRAKGAPGALDTAADFGFPSSGDPANFQIFDAGAAGDSPITQIINADALNASNACGAGCLPEMALQWNRASIAPGETWTVSFLLVDDPSLVAGGRYLRSTSLAAGADSLIVGNPVLVPEPGTYALLFAGLGVLALARRRMLV
jgi:hypothetical protein